MKNITLVFVFMLLVFTSCSKKEETIIPVTPSKEVAPVAPKTKVTVTTTIAGKTVIIDHEVISFTQFVDQVTNKYCYSTRVTMAAPRTGTDWCTFKMPTQIGNYTNWSYAPNTNPVHSLGIELRTGGGSWIATAKYPKSSWNCQIIKRTPISGGGVLIEGTISAILQDQVNTALTLPVTIVFSIVSPYESK
jgi:hypothetical protein